MIWCNMICTYPAMFNPFFLKPMIFGETDMNSLGSGTNCQAWLIIDLHFFVKTSWVVPPKVRWIPSGKLSHNYGKSLNGKPHYFYGHVQWLYFDITNIVNHINPMVNSHSKSPCSRWHVFSQSCTRWHFCIFMLCIMCLMCTNMPIRGWVGGWRG